MRCYRTTHKEERAEYYRRYYKAHWKETTERHRCYREIHKEEKKKYNRQWRKENQEKVRAIQRKNGAKKFGTPKGKLDQCFSQNIRESLKGSKAGRHWEDLVGYTVDQLMKHLEKLFKPGMTWENYGTVWEIDHKTPKAVFNYARPGDLDFRICWSLKNLQPLEKSINRSKQAKLEKPFQPSLLLG